MYEMYVIIGTKTEWGKGYGSQAINQIISIVKQNNINTLVVKVKPSNKRAIRAYEKSGFKLKNPVNKNAKLLVMNISFVN